MMKYLEALIKDRRRAAGEDPEVLPTLDELKAEYIEYLLDRTFQNKTETARILNISRTALYYRLSVQQMGGHDSCVCLTSPRPPSSH
jgi:DNA-binding NtrC family response regulator